MGTAPERIFLQWHGDANRWEREDADFSPDHADVTWCADKVFEHDIEYIRADAAEARVNKAVEEVALETMRGPCEQ